MAAFGAKISIPTEHGSVGIEFWVRFGLTLGHLEVLLGLCYYYYYYCYYYSYCYYYYYYHYYCNYYYYYCYYYYDDDDDDY